MRWEGYEKERIVVMEEEYNLVDTGQACTRACMMMRIWITRYLICCRFWIFLCFIPPSLVVVENRIERTGSSVTFTLCA